MFEASAGKTLKAGGDLVARNLNNLKSFTYLVPSLGGLKE
jgi:hypothetical protein